MSSDMRLITTPSGSFSTRATATAASEFLGIPFATAGRFEPPVDITSGYENFDASKYGFICPQTPGMLEMALNMNASQMNEDCLNLNVYIPHDPVESQSLPVLVWIHGGAYTNGAGSIAWYNGSSLASRGCIVVTINYRLGSLGFLGDGNYGILDMLSALR
jgi:para-nitrobenzyl esterase